MDADPDGSQTSGDDELARWRRKHRTSRAGHTVDAPDAPTGADVVQLLGRRGSCTDIAEALGYERAQTANMTSSEELPVESPANRDRLRNEDLMHRVSTAHVVAASQKRALDEVAWRLRAVERLQSMLSED